MRSMPITAAKQLPRLEDRPVPEPGPGEVRLRVHACGVCHSDQFVFEALWPGLELPRVPGHEVVGTVDALGSGVTGFAEGDLVGVGWHGGHDGTCPACRRGRFVHCESGAITGITRDGGYQEYTVAPASALARVPSGMDPVDAAPLLCAGVTTFNALRNSGARPGTRVAIQGLGGLGHLGVQYAAKMGFETIAVSRGADKAKLAKELGAHEYLDTESVDAAEKLTAMGGADVILATAPNAAAISSLVPGLGIDGTLIVVGAPFEPLSVGAIDLISRSAGVRGGSSGDANDSTDALEFAHRTGVRSHNEVFPLEEAGKAYQRMMSGKARFRVVLDVQGLSSARATARPVGVRSGSVSERFAFRVLDRVVAQEHRLRRQRLLGTRHAPRRRPSRRAGASPGSTGSRGSVAPRRRDCAYLHGDPGSSPAGPTP
ncbi:MAG: alcohol dehydrogenase [Planctomycetota bacterium]